MATFSGRSTKAAILGNGANADKNIGALAYLGNIIDGTTTNRPIVEWDLSSIEGMTADADADVTLYMEGTDWIGNFTSCNLYRVLRAWGEGDSATWTAADAGEVTWNSARHSQESWATAGADNTTTDRSGTAEDEVANPGSAANLVGTITQATIQVWLDAAADNHGVVVQLAGGTGTRYWYFWSDDQTGTTSDPLLEFEYTDPFLDDYSGNNNDLTNNNSVIEETTDVPNANITTVAEFSGANYLEILDANQLGLDLSSTFTMEMWFKYTGADFSAYPFLISKDGTGQRAYGLNIYPNTNINMMVTDGTNYDHYKGSALSVDTWYHIAITCNVGNASATTFEFFLNGSSVGNGTSEVANNISAINNSTAPFIVGGRKWTGTLEAPWTGYIGDVRIWNDVRTAQEIADNYENHLADPEGEANLVAYYPFEELPPANTVPTTPTVTAPTDSATGVSINPAATSSAFSDSDGGDTHQASQWLLSDDSGFTSTEWDSGEDTTNKTSIDIDATDGTFGGTLTGETALAYETQYWLKVRHQDSAGGWSAYSTAISFTTLEEEVAPNTPSITAPADDATDVAVRPTLTGDAFSDANTGATHKASQWQIATDAGFSNVIWDSGTTLTNKTSVLVNSTNGTFAGVLDGATLLGYETEYYAQVRYQDEDDNWSAYSTAVSFTTEAAPVASTSTKKEGISISNLQSLRSLR